MKELYKNYPVHVDINGKPYSINADFRLMMQFELSAQREDKNSIAEILSEFYYGNIPPDIDAAVHRMIVFYLCGEEPDNKKSSSGNREKKRCYAFDEDWKFITSAFRHQYGIDIINSKMHWYEFSALFSGLTDETEFVKIMQYRCTDIRKIKNKEEKNRIRRLQQRYALSENKIKHFSSAADRDADMINNLRKSLLQRK
jgi:hypothetical protein